MQCYKVLNTFKNIQKNVDIKTRERTMRILLRANGNVNQGAQASNECDYCLFL